MGLLDEAIREHLELKRRHGANPEEVARAEREALGPAVRDRGTAAPAADVATGEPDPLVPAPPAEPEASHDELSIGEPEASLGASELTHAMEPIEAVPEEPEPPHADEPEPPQADEEPELPPLEEAPPAHPEEPPPAPAPEPAATSLEALEVSPLPEPEAPPPRPEAQPVAPPAPEPRGDQPTEVFDADEIFAEEEAAASPAPPAAPPAEDEREDVERRWGAPPGPPEEEGEGEVEDVLEETPEFLQETPEHERLWFEQKPPRDFDFDG